VLLLRPRPWPRRRLTLRDQRRRGTALEKARPWTRRWRYRRIATATALKFLITMHIDSILRKIILHQDTQVHPFVKKREKTHAYIYHDIMCIKASRFLLSVYALIPHLERSYYTRHANTTKKHMNSCVRVTQPTRVTCMLELEFVSSPRACLVSSRAARVHRLQNSRAVRPLLHTRDATDRE
jgi:hypothetical protein